MSWRAFDSLRVSPIVEAIKPDANSGEAPELPVLEKNRKAGSTGDVSFWTSRDVREVERSHINLVVADTDVWEQTAAYMIDHHPRSQRSSRTPGSASRSPISTMGRLTTMSLTS